MTAQTPVKMREIQGRPHEGVRDYRYTIANGNGTVLKRGTFACTC